LRKRRTIGEKQSYGYLTLWQRLLLVSTLLLSGEISVGIVPSQTAHAINCVAGHGGHGGMANGGQLGAAGDFGGDCVIGGEKSRVIGGLNQNNGDQGDSQTNGLANAL
jgi:hypothetical protein